MRTQIVPTIIQLNAIKWNISNYKYKDDGKFDKLLVHMIMESESDFTQTSASMWKKKQCVCGWVELIITPTLIARFMGPAWVPSGADRTQVGPMLAPWTLLSGNDISLKLGNIPMVQYQWTNIFPFHFHRSWQSFYCWLIFYSNQEGVVKNCSESHELNCCLTLINQRYFYITDQIISHMFMPNNIWQQISMCKRW